MKTQTHLVQRLLLTLLVLILFPAHAQNPLPPETVLARNKHVVVTYSDFEAELARIPAADRFEFLLSRERIARIVENILINKTLALEARENKLDLSPSVKAEIANQTDKVLAKYRGQQVQSNLPKIDLLPLARERYLTSPEKVTKKELHDVWHVLISAKGRTPEQTRARAEEVHQKLLAGESREKLAQEYSDDASKSTNQGRLGPLDASIFDPRFAKTVRSMKVGDVAYAESTYGVHVVKLLDHVPGARISFDAAKVVLMQEAETEYIVSSWNNYIRNLSNDPQLFVDVDALDRLRPKLPDIPATPPLASGIPHNEAPTVSGQIVPTKK